MSTASYFPDGNGDSSGFSQYPVSGSHYDKVDETTHDGNTTYVYRAGGNSANRFELFTFTDDIPAGATINSVTIYWRQTMWDPNDDIYLSSGGPTILSYISDGTNTNIDGTAEDTSDYDTEVSRTFSTNPAGSSWSYSDLATLQFGFTEDSIGTLKKDTRITQCRIEIDYTAGGTFGTPSALECDFQTNPTLASDNPVFTAIFDEGSESGSADRAYVEIYDDSGLSNLVAESGWVTIASVSDSSRCAPVKYDDDGASGNWTTAPSLKTGAAYYWRIKFKNNGSSIESNWSSIGETATFSGFKRDWADDSYIFRRKIKLNTNHAAVPQNYTGVFSLKTGNRSIIATNGFFNESVAASGGYGICNYAGRTHVVYLGQIGPYSGWAEIWIVSKESNGGWGTPQLIHIESGNYFDTHFYACLDTDGSGYIHVLISGHNSQLRHIRSRYPNESGAIPSDTYYNDRRAWIDPAALPSIKYNRFWFEDKSGVTGQDDLFFNPDMHFWDDPSQDVVKYRITIDSIGTPDTFKWESYRDSDSTWYTYDTGIAITGEYQIIGEEGSVINYFTDHGLRIRFEDTTGHTNGDSWIIHGEGNSSNSAPDGMVGTYPVVWYESKADRLYCFYRYGNEIGKSAFQYLSTPDSNSGCTWSDPLIVVQDGSYPYRIYPYGQRYDPLRDIYHYSFTINEDHNPSFDVQQGIWYIYSIRGETNASSVQDSEGFNIWRWANGTIAGYSDDGVISGYPVPHLNSEAIRLSVEATGATDPESVFTESLAISRDGKPVVFWEQKYTGGPTAETDLVCATWSGDLGSSGSWEEHYVSQQVNKMLRVRRSSLGVMTDKDGTIRAWVPVNGKTWFLRVPESTYSTTGTVISTGADTWSVVDDGRAQRGPLSEYITVAASSKIIWANSSQQLPDDATIFSVRVRIWTAKTGGTTTSGNIVLNIGGTEYTGPVNIGGIARYSYDWDENPDTAAAWTVSDVNSLKWGLQVTDTTDGAYVYNCYLEVFYSVQSDDEWFATEIYQIKSSDNGVTWENVREESRNSSLGVPTINHKHTRTADKIEIIWSSGNDIFYYEYDPYGLMLETGDDIRIFSQTNSTATELDRVFDYPNLDESKVYFKFPVAVSADEEYPDDRDFYVYYGGKNGGATAVKGDPNNVFLFFEGWESYDSAAEATSAGWTLSGCTIYKSPDQHANKLYGGMTALSAGSGSYDILGNLANVIVECGCWQEFGSWADDYVGFSLKDDESTPNEVAVRRGYAGASNRYGAITTDGSTWLFTDGSDMQEWFVPRANNYNYWGIYADSSAGVINVTCNGFDVSRKLATALTGVTTLSLQSDVAAYFDHIKAYYKLKSFSGSIASTYNKITDIAYWSTVSINSDKEWDNKSVFDAHYSFQEIDEIWKIVVTLHVVTDTATAGSVTFRVWLQEYSGSDYDAAVEPLHHKDVTISYSSSATHTATVTWEYPQDQALKSLTDFSFRTGYGVKVDAYAYTGNAGGSKGIQKIEVYTYDVNDPIITLEDQEVKGVYASASLQGIGEQTVRGSYSVTGTLTNSKQAFPGEIKANIAYNYLIPISHKGGLLTSNRVPVEALGGPVFTMVVPTAHGEFRTAAASSPTAYIGLVAYKHGTPIDYHQWVFTKKASPVEIQSSRSVKHLIPLEVKDSFWAVGPQLIEVGGGVAAKTRIPEEHIGSLNIKERANVEHQQGVAVAGNIPLTYHAAVRMASLFPVEFTELFSRKDDVRLEFVQLVELNPPGSPVEHGLAISPVNQRAPLMYYTGVIAGQQIPVEVLSSVQEIGTPLFPVEFKQGLSSISQFPSQILVDRRVSPTALVSHSVFFDIKDSHPVEHGVLADIRFGYVPVSFIPAITPVSVRALLESAKGVASAGAIPAQYPGPVLVTCITPVENVKTAVPISSSSPVEALVQNGSASGRIPSDYVTAVSNKTAIPSDYSGILPVGSGVVPVEFGIRIEPISGEIYVDHAAGANIRSLKVPASWSQLVELTGEIPADHIENREMSSTSPVESLVSNPPVTTGLRIEALGGINEHVVIPVQIVGGRAFTSQLWLDYAAAFIGTFPLKVRVDWVAGVEAGVKTPVAHVHTVTSRGETPLEATLGHEYKPMVPVEMGSSIEEIALLTIPVEVKGGVAQGLKLPASYELGVVETSRVLVENGLSSTQSAAFAVAYGAGFRQATKIITDYLAGTNVQVNFRVEWKAGREFGLAARIEYGKTFSTTQLIQLDQLKAVMVEAGIPASWWGTILAAIIIQNVSLKTAGLANPAMAVPEIQEALVKVSKVTGQALSTSQLDALAMKVAKVTEQVMKTHQG